MSIKVKTMSTWGILIVLSVIVIPLVITDTVSKVLSVVIIGLIVLLALQFIYQLVCILKTGKEQQELKSFIKQWIPIVFGVTICLVLLLTS